MTPLTCPSAPAEPGAVLLGVKGAAGRIVPVRTAMVVDEAFVHSARTHGPPEARMRFAAPCQTKGCAQWTGSQCGVIARVMAHLGADTAAADALPPCLIRGSSRWFREKGGAACGVCDLIVTDQAAMTAV